MSVQVTDASEFAPQLKTMSADLIRSHRHRINCETDRLFGVLLGLQWVAAVIVSLIIDPRTWVGVRAEIHIHVWATIFFGGLLTIFPWILIRSMPGEAFTRHVIALCQLLFSSLLIMVTDGRVETHFHVFGSLAFLAFYRDWRVLLTASIVTAADHFFRGIVYPISIYGVVTSSPWRSLEHTGWVVFTDIFLFISCYRSKQEMKQLALDQAKSDLLNRELKEHAQKLEESAAIIHDQQKALLFTGKMTALGEMAGGIAHEINTPLTNISLLAGELKELSAENLTAEEAQNISTEIEATTERIGKIIRGLKTFSRDGTKDPFRECKLKDLIDDTLFLCRERFKQNSIEFHAPECDDNIILTCQPTQISQVFLNVINNAFDAVLDYSEKWVRVSVREASEFIEIKVTDSGKGISKKIEDKIFDPFFTTKDVGKGTGLGLSLSKGIIKHHHGQLYVDHKCPHTCFIIRLPKSQSVQESEKPAEVNLENI